MEHGHPSMVNMCEQSLVEAKTPEFCSSASRVYTTRPSDNLTGPKSYRRTDTGVPPRMTIHCPPVLHTASSVEPTT